MIGNNQSHHPQEKHDQNLGSIISSNLKRLISQNGLTQKELADKLGVAAASMTDYCKGRRIPNVEFFVSLKNLYNISIDDFLTKSISPSSNAISLQPSIIDHNIMNIYLKYCGIYYIFYFDTSKYKGKDTQPPKDSVLYGILIIHENPSSLDMPGFSSAAILGIQSREEASTIKQALENCKEPAKIIDYIESNHSHTAYFGNFELSQEHAFITLNHTNTDKALLILHRVDNNKANYSGGIGTVNSVSKGRERAPVVQFMGISRYPLTMSTEEIHHSLLLSYPSFTAEAETEEMIRNFKTLYLNSEESKQEFSEYQKSIIVRSALERFVKKSLERNMFRYGKVSERDDDEWYHAIKVASINSSD